MRDKNSGEEILSTELITVQCTMVMAVDRLIITLSFDYFYLRSFFSLYYCDSLFVCFFSFFCFFIQIHELANQALIAGSPFGDTEQGPNFSAL